MKTINDAGWNEFFENNFSSHKKEGLLPARVIAEHRESYVVFTDTGVMDAEVTGRFRFDAVSASDYPKTGDWVAVSPTDGSFALIHALLPRRSVFSRKAAGKTAEEQVLAANIDTAFIVQGLDDNYNNMRLARFVTSLCGTDIKPVVILNKTDLNPESSRLTEETKELFPIIEVLRSCALTGEGLEQLENYLKPGSTCVFTGSSGVGKSTIINSLLGSADINTKEVSSKGARGRHTTVARQLYFLKNGAMLIDTPGIRELALWSGGPESSTGFAAIDKYSVSCRYRDCSHEKEPGCAVKAAFEAGDIPPEIMKSYVKLKKEAEYLMSKTDEKAGEERKRKEKQLGRAVKGFYKTSKKRENR